MIRLFLSIFLFNFAFGYEYAILQKEEMAAHADELAHLRITVFREYPYLYDGDVQYEKDYLQQYFITKNSVLVIAKEGDKIIGAITGIPLNETFSDCKDLFVRKQIPMDSIYYLGEITLLKEYRGQGIGAQMYEIFEQFVRESKIYRQIAFCEVISPKDDPRRTNDYFCLDNFWTKRNYLKYPELVTYYSWKELESETEFYHPLVFWMKDLLAFKK